MGGIRLDLHQLFIDVTTRGGFEKVYDFFVKRKGIRFTI